MRDRCGPLCGVKSMTTTEGSRRSALLEAAGSLTVGNSFTSKTVAILDHGMRAELSVIADKTNVAGNPSVLLPRRSIIRQVLEIPLRISARGRAAQPRAA